MDYKIKYYKIMFTVCVVIGLKETSIRLFGISNIVPKIILIFVDDRILAS